MQRNLATGILTSALIVAHGSALRAQEPSAAPTAESAPATEGTPAPAEPPKQAPTDAAAQKVEQLERELASIMDELIQARTRASVLVKTLFRTPIAVRVVRRADDQRLAQITLKLDGVPVHSSDGAALSSGEAQLFAGFAAPGSHELTIEVTEEARERAAYRYTRSERFTIEVAKDTRTEVELVLRDDSDMAEQLPEGDEGEYDVRTILRVSSEKVSKD
jgi:hypothetical protein